MRNRLTRSRAVNMDDIIFSVDEALGYDYSAQLTVAIRSRTSVHPIGFLRKVLNKTLERKVG